MQPTSSSPVIYTPETLDEVAALLLAADGRPCPRVEGVALVALDGDGPKSIVIELSRVPELNRLDYDEREGLLIGAAVPLQGILDFPPFGTTYAIFADAVRCLPPEEEVPVTLGAVLGNARPASEFLAPLICLGASAAVFGPHGWSEMAVEALARRQGPVLHAGEFLVDVRLPASGPRAGGAFLRSPQPEAGVGAFVLLQDDFLTCCGARVAAWSGTALPLRALDAERSLQGRSVDEATIRRAADLIAESGGAQQEVLQALAVQAIRSACERARPG